MPGKNKRTKHWSTRQHFLSEMERKGRRFTMSEVQQAEKIGDKIESTPPCGEDGIATHPAQWQIQDTDNDEIFYSCNDHLVGILKRAAIDEASLVRLDV
jgi:hypothetical protein